MICKFCEKRKLIYCGERYADGTQDINNGLVKEFKDSVVKNIISDFI